MKRLERAPTKKVGDFGVWDFIDGLADMLMQGMGGSEDRATFATLEIGKGGEGGVSDCMLLKVMVLEG